MYKKFSLTLYVLITISLISCKDDDRGAIPSNKVIFGFSNSSISGRITEEFELTQLHVTIENEIGEIVYNDKIILNQFDEAYESDPISLNLGSYRLTAFFVLDSDSIVRYATPVEGSELAHLVNHPLPIHFVVNRDDVTHIEPEVISTDEGSSVDFGYTTFNFNVVETFDLLIGVLVYDYTSKHYELTEANLTITNEEDTVLRSELFDVTNKVVLSKRYENLKLIVDKAGYNAFENTFTIDSLMQHDGTNPYGPLEIILEQKIDISAGLIAYYPFNGNANDESLNNNNGIVVGPVLTTDRFGNANSAYEFDGTDDYINLGTSSVLDLGFYDEFTISVWINAHQDTISVGETILGKYDSFQDRRSFSMSYIPSDKVGFTTYEAGTLSDFNRVSTDMPTGWSHLLVTYSANILELRVNGVMVDSLNTTFPIHSGESGVDFEIGATHRNGISENLNFEGLIDDIRIYDRVLNENEIQLLFE